MSKETEWITLATTPPSSEESFERLVKVLQDAKIDFQIEDNLVRQCERDPAAWLRVHADDLPQALDLKQRLVED